MVYNVDMKISVIATTFYPSTHGKRFIDTLSRTNPDVSVTMVDQSKKRFKSKSAALNYGASLNTESDILIFCDDDIIWEGEIKPPNAALFGPSLLGNRHISYSFEGNDIILNTVCGFLDGWCIGVRRWLYDTIGGFDENFINSGMQDADFCIVAYKLGIEPMEWKFPGEHLTAGTKFLINPEHLKTRVENILYLGEKHNIEQHVVSCDDLFFKSI